MKGRPGGRRRTLRPDEIDLWRQVLRDVTPMPGTSFDILLPPPSPATVEPTPPALLPTPAKASEGRAKPPPSIPLPPLAPLERRLRQKLSRGRTDVDAALDLHGLRQDEAHTRLRRFLLGAQADGCRLVLVVTGKGSSNRPAFEEVGILRRNVPHWLRAPDMRGIVVSVEEATATHGGSGALYVRLRRSDKPRRSHD
jgi:DNA-nicking Smr family endonuclease